MVSLAEKGDEEAQAELDAIPALPPLASYIWDWWLEIAETRQSGGFAPARLTRHDIHAWETDTSHRLWPWERRLVLKLDGLWLKSTIRNDKEEGK